MHYILNKAHLYLLQLSSTGSGMFATATVNAPITTYDTSTYREVLTKLDSLWSDKMREIESISDVSVPSKIDHRKHIHNFHTGALEQARVPTGTDKEDNENR